MKTVFEVIFRPKFKTLLVSPITFCKQLVRYLRIRGAIRKIKTPEGLAAISALLGPGSLSNNHHDAFIRRAQGEEI